MLCISSWEMEKNSTYICLFIYVRLPKSCGVNQSKKKLSQKTHKFSDDLFKMPSNSINSINKKVFMLFESFGLCLFHFQSIKTKNERKKTRSICFTIHNQTILMSLSSPSMIDCIHFVYKMNWIEKNNREFVSFHFNSL